MERVLVVEDEIGLARLIQLELEHAGYNVDVCFDGESGLTAGLKNEYDYILLDLMLPKLNGIDICKKIRAIKKTPILMLTARDTVIDRVQGLDSGADDYIGKPFQMEEVLARIRAIRRRIGKERRQNLTIGNLTVHLGSHQVSFVDQPIDLPIKEYNLLKCLLENKNKVMTREALLSRVWGTEFLGATNVVDVYIRYLRQKIDGRFKQKFIQTVRGVGYVIREDGK